MYNLLPYVTSDFSTHSLLNVIYIVANAIAAAIYIPLAKVLDLWGRAEGFLIMVTFATMGLVMMAACNNLPTFCAAYVSIGYFLLFNMFYQVATTKIYNILIIIPFYLKSFT